MGLVVPAQAWPFVGAGISYNEPMSLHQVAQHASDLNLARHFCEEHLGATFIAAFDPPGLLFMSIGNIRLLLEQQAPSAPLYYDVDDVAAKVEELRAKGVTIETEAHTIFQDAEGLFGPAGTEERMAFIRDSEGNVIGLVSRYPLA